MKQPGAKPVIAGFALLAGLIGLFTFSFFAAAVRDSFEERYELIAVFPIAPRLRVGSPVWLAGREVGRVTSIGFRPLVADSTPSLAVAIQLPVEFQERVRRDSRLRLTSERTIGEPVVDISPGSLGQPVLRAGDTLFADPRPDPTRIFTGILTLKTEFDSLVASTRALDPLILRRGAQFQRVAQSLEGAQREFANLRAAFGSANVRGFSDGQLTEALASIGRTADQVTAAFADAAARYRDPELRATFDRLTERGKALSAEVATLRETFANSTLSRFAQDSAITRALHKAQVELDSLVAETKRNPLRFWLGDSKRPLGDPLKR